jgi:hypothetical protein
VIHGIGSPILQATAQAGVGMKKIVSFKVEPALAEFLASLPNKSEFVRQAVLAQFGMTCPLCTGSGVVPRGIGDHFADAFRQHATRPCAGCGRDEPVPGTAEGVPDADRPRVEQFLHGGPLYCADCYPTSPACRVCGWHIPPDRIGDHDKEHHPG